MKIRSFLAFELPPPLKAGVEEVQRRLRDRLGGVRWVPAGNIHLTIIFLGEVDRSDVASIAAAAQETCAGFSPFKLALEGVGTFGGRRNPRVLWVGLAGDIESMGNLRDALQVRLKPFGVQEERRPFRPHLTLGRFKAGIAQGPELRGCLSEHAALQSPPALLEGLTLFKSDLKPGGAVYTRLEAWPLKDGV